MKPNTTELLGAQKGKRFQGQGPNWILIAGGALLSTLSVRLGFRLKQALDSKQLKNSRSGLKENGKASARKRPANRGSHSNLYSFGQDDSCYNCTSGIEPETALPLATVSVPAYSKDSSVMWASSPDRLELPQKPYNHSSIPGSPSVSESGSDIFTKREVIQKLRQQLKRRDDMILEMQDQIAELQNGLSSQRTRSDHLQSLLEAANRDLFDSEREIQRLRKAVADISVGGEKSYENGNGFQDLECLDKGAGGNEVDKIEMLKKEVEELKELIQGKDYLLQNYKEQKSELSLKVKELQHRLDSQVPSIL